MIERRSILVAAVAATTLLGGCATRLSEEGEGLGPSEQEVLGLDDTTSAAADEPALIELDEFGRRSYDDGWSAERLIGLDVRGAEGASIGEVDNIVIGPEGDIRSLIIGVGGFLGIGDTALKVPWNEVTMSDNASGELRYAAVPIAKGDEERYSLFDGSDAASDGPRTFRASELIGDYVTLDGTGDYAYVDDIVFDEDGQLQAVVVSRNSALGGGYYAYPFYGYDHGFDPGLGVYNLPYGADDVGGLAPFDYGTLGGFGTL